MPTPFSDVYSIFQSKIFDADLALMSEATAEDLQYKYLRSACTRFSECDIDLTDIDIEKATFNQTLPYDVQEILATYMIVEWLSPKIYTADLLQQTMATKDFTLYSQANHIKEIRELRKYALEEAANMVIKYTYKDGVGDLK